MPWHLAPSLRPVIGLPVLGSEPSSWGCFLTLGHVLLSLSICCPASLHTALSPSSLDRAAWVGRRNVCWNPSLISRKGSASGLGVPGSCPHEQCSVRKREESGSPASKKPRDLPCTRLLDSAFHPAFYRGIIVVPFHLFIHSALR